MIIWRSMVVSTVIPLLLAVAGCGTGVNTAEVEGTVKVDGKPVNKILVEFWPVTSGPRSFGTTDDQGRFVLTTDNGKSKGAVIGSHKIVLHDAGALGDEFLGRRGEDVDMAKGKMPRISGEYSDPQKSNITKEVVAGKKNEFDLDVQPYAAANR